MADTSKYTRAFNRQLYPTGRAWYYIHGSDQVDTVISDFVDGLGNPFVDGLGNHFIASHGSEASPGKRLNNAILKSYERLYTEISKLNDYQLADNDNFDEIDASNWERVFGLSASGKTLDERKEAILRKQGFELGTPEKGHYQYVQDQLQAAGFDVYVHENRFADGTGNWDVVNPDDIPETFTICANHIDETLDSTFFDDFFYNNEYGVAEYGVAEYQPFIPIPTDVQLRATFFITASNFPDTVDVLLSRKEEFRHLLLQLKPCQTVGFLNVNYI